MKATLSLFLAMLLVSSAHRAAHAQLPADVAAALKDAETYPKEDQRFLRYLSLGHLPLDRRELWYLASSVNINELSHAEAIYRPKLVEGTAGAVIRLDLRHYDLHTKDKLAVWEKLAEADPFGHIREETYDKVWVDYVWPGGKYNGVYEKPGSFRVQGWEKRNKKIKTVPFSPDPKGAITLGRLAALLYTDAPIVMADWFYCQTCTQKIGDGPGYYDFHGIKTERDYQLIGGLDVKSQVFEDFANRLRGSLSASGITREPRAFVIRETLTGGLFATFDFEVANKGKDPLRLLGVRIEDKYTASEQYILMKNRLFGYGLFNKAGVAQRQVPPQIATDRLSKSNGQELVVGISCKRCHTVGLQPLDDDFVRKSAEHPFAAIINDHDPDVREKLRREYFRVIEPKLEAGRVLFAGAVKEATGWTVPQYAARVAECWEEYEDARCTIHWVAARAGVNVDDLARAIDASIKAKKGDPVLSSLLPREGRTPWVGIRQAEELVIPAMILMKGVKK